MTTPTIAERVEQLVREGTTTTPAIVAAMPGVSSTSVYAAMSKLVQPWRPVGRKDCTP